MRLLIFIIIMLTIDLYAFQAFRTVMSSWLRSPRMWVTVLYFLLTVLALLYFFGNMRSWFDHWPKIFGIYATAFVFIIFFSKLSVAIFLLVDDLRRILLWLINLFPVNEDFDLSRSRFMSQLSLLVGAVPFISLSYGVIRNQYRYQVRRRAVALKNLPTAFEGLRIIQISDIHSGSFTFKEPIKNGIKMINDLKPDLVFFTGDIVNTVADEMDPYIEIFSQIKSKYGIFSVLGNHDYGDYKAWNSSDEKEANFNKLLGVHRQLGWELLRNENRVLEIDNERLAVIGVENISALTRFHSYGNLSEAYLGTEDVGLRMLLSHDPTHWEAEVVQKFHDIDLTFSGHTHGFQFGIEIPGWIKWSPSKYVYKHWAGLYTMNNQYLYVNRGFGTLGYPGRVGILPEITCLELKSA